MDVVSILITAFVVMSIFSSHPPDQAPPSTQRVCTMYEFITSPNRNSTLFSADDDYRVINKFISTKYKKIPASEADTLSRSIVKHGGAFKVEPRLIAALIARESGFNRLSVSSSDAKGLGQIKDFNFATLQIDDPFDIDQGVRGCAKYFAMMLSRYPGNPNQVSLALASYNEGANAVYRASCTWRPETDIYIRDINTTYKRLTSE